MQLFLVRLVLRVECIATISISSVMGLRGVLITNTSSSSSFFANIFAEVDLRVSECDCARMSTRLVYNIGSYRGVLMYCLV